MKSKLTHILECYHLKSIKRTGWLREGVPDAESVAAHSWATALLCSMLMEPELNRAKVLEMAILHDLPEVQVGDITPLCGISPSEKKSAELSAMKIIANQNEAPHWLEIFEEYEENKSPEAQFVKKMDKLDMALQALLYESAYQLDLKEFVDSALVLAKGYLEDFTDL